MRGEHQGVGLGLGLDRQRQVHSHLVAVEVGVEACADQRVHLDGVALDEDGFEGLDAHAVQRRRAVEQHRVLVDDFLEDVPHLGLAPLEHALGALDGVGVAVLLELADDEGLVELQRDLLGKATLVQLQLRAHDDDRTRGVVHALAQQVLAEAALLALDHVGQRLERPAAGADDGPAAAAVVEERVHRLLQHPLLVADDDLRRVEVHQLLQAVVAVDDAAVEVVQVAGGEVAAVQQHQRPQIGRDHGNDVEHQPGGVVLRLADLLDQLEPLGEVLDLLLAAGLAQRLTDGGGLGVQVQPVDELADGLGAHHRLEG